MHIFFFDLLRKAKLVKMTAFLSLVGFYMKLEIYYILKKQILFRAINLMERAAKWAVSRVKEPNAHALCRSYVRVLLKANCAQLNIIIISFIRLLVSLVLEKN